MSRFAAIDIGTNTILMVVAAVKIDGTINILADEHQIARLGENLHKTHFISDIALSRANKILKHFREICNDLNVNSIKVCGTSALRDAQNQSDIIASLSETINSDIEVISGAEEARLSFLGTVEDDDENLVIDIGGGSTEYIIGKKDDIKYRQSLNIGAVRLTEKFIENHPPDDYSLKKLIEHIRKELDANIKPEHEFKKIYAVAGTPTTIAAIAMGLLKYSDDKVHGYILKLDELKTILNLFTQNHLDYLINELLIHPKRADVITAGTIILIESLKHLRMDSCVVSSKGLRYGILKSLINN